MDSKGPSLYAPPGTSVDLTRSVDEDSLLDGPLISADALHSAIRREFQTVPTQCYAGLLSLLHVLYVVFSVCVAVLCVLEFGKEEMCVSVLSNVPGDSAIVYGKACLWVLVLLFTWYMQHHHNQARRRGYLQFYRAMQELKDLPLTIHSTGNVLLLVTLVAGLSSTVRIYLLLSILCLELLVAMPCLLCYTETLKFVREYERTEDTRKVADYRNHLRFNLRCRQQNLIPVMWFNRERAAPDVSQEDHLHNYSTMSMPTETGFREGSSLEEVVEKQADLIEYLKQHNTLLSKRLLNLTAQH